MPYKNIEITPAQYSEQFTNKKSQFYKGFSTVDSAEQTTKIYDFELVKRNILNHFSTRKGSRVMNPEFGTIIWDLIMEPLTPEIRNLITKDINSICTNDVRAYPLQININEYDQGYLIEITMALKNTNQTSKLKVVFDQTLGLKAQ